MQITSLYIESTTEVMGNQAPTKTYIVNGKGYRNESDFGGQRFVQVITDKGGWMINPFGGSGNAAAIPDDQFHASAEAVYIDPFLDYAANGARVELQGQEKVGDVNAYKIKLTNKYNSDMFFYFDPATWYIIQTVNQSQSNGQPVTVTVTYADYQKTDAGLVFPSKTHLDTGQFALDMTANKTEVNKVIDLSIFDMPK
ncbi:hypothetical protein [Parafilimonas sp.]|uniref:hypothetical protein n=1 Tax=Parafilimonas sp. TaxID=1969739 RepID=UPI0039E50D34